VGNGLGIEAEPDRRTGSGWSAEVTLPPLGVLWLTPDP
jgi:hypothetical protein